MDAADLLTLKHTALWAAFGVSVLFGWIAQRTQFCTMGAISDVVNMGSWTRMRMWGMAVGVGMLGFYGLGSLGWINTSMSIYTGGRIVWLSATVGGLLFGFGMVLASGCGSKTLVRMGTGSLKALVVFFVMGFAAFATLRGVLAVARVNTVDRVAFDIPAGGALPMWLSQATGWSSSVAGLFMALVIGGGLVVWALMDEEFRTARGLLAGFGLGAVITLMWWISGHLGFVAEHPETLDPVYLASTRGRLDSLSCSVPIAYMLDWLIYFRGTTKVLTLVVVSVVGVVLGSFVQALGSRSFRWEGFRDTQDTALHLVGAVCMGVGGVTAMGCTVGQGLSGLSTLSLTSIIAVAAIVAGAWLGFRFQIWLLERE